MSVDVRENINGIIYELGEFVKNPNVFIDKQFETFFDNLKSSILRMYILSNFNEDQVASLKQRVQNKITELFCSIEDFDFKRDYQKGELLIQKFNLTSRMDVLSKLF